MFVSTRRNVVLTLLGCTAAFSFMGCSRDPEPVVGTSQAARTTTLVAQYLQIPLGFEVNRGQTHGDVKFLSRGLGYSLLLTATEAVFSFSPQPAHAAEGNSAARSAAPAVVRMTMVGSSASPLVEGLDRQAGVSHYLTGADPRSWQRNVERFGKVLYNEVYPGVDAIYYGNQQQLEYDFVVAPGADPQQIRLAFDGVESLRLDRDGNLVMTTAAGELTQHKPIAYQEIGGQRRSVPSAYRILSRNQIAFDVGRYDRKHALTIDPVLVYSTLLGGQDSDWGQGIAVDQAGDVYVTGSTVSVDFPSHQGVQPDLNDGYDAFVTKISAAGDRLIYSTYLGGTASDGAEAIAVDEAGNALITGLTISPDFPLRAAWQTAMGSTDAFVAKLDPSGSELVYSTYLGGSLEERGHDIAVDSIGNAYIAGETSSDDLPTTPGVFQRTAPGDAFVTNAFVTKLSPRGTRVYTTYFGGAGADRAYSIAVDNAGNVYIGGDTRSSDLATAGAFQTVRYGWNDGFIAKITPTANALAYVTYLGGDEADFVYDLKIDGAGNVFATGRTESSNFPLENPFQDQSASGFVAKLDPTGTALVYSSYLDGAAAIAVDGEGSAYVAGSFFTPSDASVTKISPAGSLVYSTYLGGSSYDRAQDIALDDTGNVYITGDTYSGGSFPLVNPLRTMGEDVEAFVSKLVSPQWKVAGVGDTNADGNDDLLWHSPALQQLDWWQMAGATRQAIGSKFIPSQYRVAATADFNGDGRSDLLWHDNAKTTLWIWQAEADGSFSIQFVDDFPPAGWDVVGAGDVDADGRADILWHNRELEQLDWWRMDGPNRLAVGSQYIPSQYRVAATADFNGDGRTDILWHDDARTSLWVWQAESADFSIHFVDSFPPSGWQVVGAGDVNADGRADVLWHNVELQQLDWWLMAGAERWGMGSKFIPSQYRVEAIGDFNGDRRSDIFWRDEDRTTLWMWQAESDDFSIQFVDDHPPSN